MTRRKHVVRPVFLFILGASLAIGLDGCASYRMHPTPGVPSLGISKDQNRNRVATTVNTNLRAAMDDLSRLFLLDRPSRLHKQPSPY